MLAWVALANVLPQRVLKIAFAVLMLLIAVRFLDWWHAVRERRELA